MLIEGDEGVDLHTFGLGDVPSAVER